MCNKTQHKNDFDLWQQKAFAFLTRTAHQLWGKHDEDILAWLFEIGFTNKFAQDNLFGWNKLDKKRNANHWGIYSVTDITLPQGLIIPLIEQQKIQKLYIIPTNTSKFEKAYTVTGSLDIPIILKNTNKTLSIVTNPEDAFFLKQEVFDITDIAATESKYKLNQKFTDQYQNIIIFDKNNCKFLNTKKLSTTIPLSQSSLIKEALNKKINLKKIIS